MTLHLVTRHRLPSTMKKRPAPTAPEGQAERIAALERDLKILCPDIGLDCAYQISAIETDDSKNRFDRCTSIKQLVERVWEWSQFGPKRIQITTMPVKPQPTGERTWVGTDDIKNWTILAFDFDASRADKDKPATEDELQQPTAQVDDLIQHLRALGITASPARLMSGNGSLALFRIAAQDHHNKDFKRLLARIWGTLRIRWGLETLDPNKAIFNVRVPGAFNRKGTEDDKHPYRRAQLLNGFEGELTLPDLQTIAALNPTPEKQQKDRKATDFNDLPGWLTHHRIDYKTSEITTHDDQPALRYNFRCPFKDHRDPRGEKFWLIAFPGGGVAGGCASTDCAGKNFTSLRDLKEPGWRNLPDRFSADKTPDSKVTKLLKHVIDTYQPDLTLSTDGNVFITVDTIDDRGKPHRETHPLKGPAFSHWLMGAIGRDFPDEAFEPNTISAIAFNLSNRAHAKGQREEVFMRFGVGADGTHYIDSGSRDWKRIFELSPAGTVRTISYAECPVKFQRSPLMGELPELAGSDFADLNLIWRYVNVLPEHRPLFLAFVAYTPVNPGEERPWLAVSGEQQTGKSWITRTAAALTDPGMSIKDVGDLPEDRRELITIAHDHAVLTFDNGERLKNEMSAALCRLSTGTLISTRELNTTMDSANFRAFRSGVINGIGNVAKNHDLLRRCWLIPTDPAIKEDPARWLDDDELAPLLRADLPKILRALYEGIARGLKSKAAWQASGGKEERIDLPVGLSMASAIRFVLRTGLVERDALLAALEDSRETGAEISVDGNAVNGVIIDIVRRDKEFIGTAKQLLEKVTSEAKAASRWNRFFPNTPEAMRTVLMKLRPALAPSKIQAVAPSPSARPKNWTLRYLGTAEDAATEPSGLVASAKTF
jgi:hypothetical protein